MMILQDNTDPLLSLAMIVRYTGNIDDAWCFRLQYRERVEPVESWIFVPIFLIRY